ncbi:hypothetical protein LR48_Vigan232s000700 [Vigna angularis]|uniref:Uncharacterized protein n=1 Tax=Phaseolus angularis TaxID=3914 RepID=A0A0L9T6A0_PHAAN|nr:hypothetical protein LR48_Vigan232s000700 [Vigna angularis]
MIRSANQWWCAVRMYSPGSANFAPAMRELADKFTFVQLFLNNILQHNLLPITTFHWTLDDALEEENLVERSYFLRLVLNARPVPFYRSSTIPFSTTRLGKLLVGVRGNSFAWKHMVQLWAAATSIGNAIFILFLAWNVLHAQGMYIQENPAKSAHGDEEMESSILHKVKQAWHGKVAGSKEGRLSRPAPARDSSSSLIPFSSCETSGLHSSCHRPPLLTVWLEEALHAPTLSRPEQQLRPAAVFNVQLQQKPHLKMRSNNSHLPTQQLVQFEEVEVEEEKHVGEISRLVSSKGLHFMHLPAKRKVLHGPAHPGEVSRPKLMQLPP